MIDNWDNYISDIDKLIKLGRMAEVRRSLRSLSPKGIPRNWAAIVARLARRARLNYLVLRILGPLMESKFILDAPATDEEIALYGGSLIRVGARRQGLQLLLHLDDQKNPEIIMYKVDAFFSEWNYKQAIPLLKRYLKHESITDYQKLVGRLNLAAAFAFEGQNGYARDLLSHIRADSQFKGHRLLYANALEISAQISLAEKKFDQANSELLLAFGSMQEQEGIYPYFVQKWQALSNFLQNPESKENLLQLITLKEKAKEMKEWESIRQIDFFQALAKADKKLYLHLMVGTPYLNYRRVLEKKFIGPTLVPKQYLLKLNSSETFPANTLDVDQGMFLKSKISARSLTHRLLILLFRDFYRPLPVGEAFSLLYPAEYFNPETSPEKVRDLTRRLLRWFIEQKIPLTIRIDKKAIVIYPLGPIHILLSTRNRQDAILNSQASGWGLRELKENFRFQWFSSNEAASFLKVSKRTALRNLKKISLAKEMQTRGSGREKKYRLVKKAS